VARESKIEIMCKEGSIKIDKKIEYLKKINIIQITILPKNT
jgi:hypothetical protein